MNSKAFYTGSVAFSNFSCEALIICGITSVGTQGLLHTIVEVFCIHSKLKSLAIISRYIFAY